MGLLNKVRKSTTDTLKKNSSKKISKEEVSKEAKRNTISYKNKVNHQSRP